jgi:hypothetical protein
MLAIVVRNMFEQFFALQIQASGGENRIFPKNSTLARKSQSRQPVLAARTAIKPRFETCGLPANLDSLNPLPLRFRYFMANHLHRFSGLQCHPFGSRETPCDWQAR